MKLPPSPQRLVICVACLSLVFLESVRAAAIPGLFNTGVDDTGALLSAASVDPHYTLIESPDPTVPGPEAWTINVGFPVGPWLAEGPLSRWIAPSPAQGAGNAPGNYTFRTKFNLTGFDPAKAIIYGRWATDNEGVAVLVNGMNWGIINNTGFGDFGPEFIINGAEGAFVDGENTLDFILANAGASANPVGIRVQLTGIAELAGEAPTISEQPLGTTVLAGADVTLRVLAGGTSPLGYQWYLGTQPLSGATEPTLVLTALTPEQSGEYKVRVSNSVGQRDSEPALVNVLLPIPNLFNTGVGPDLIVLEDNALDAHYVLVINPDDPASQEAIVENSTLFPIVAGPWIANNDLSKWIGPRLDTAGASAGQYTYRISVDLTGLDPTTAFLTGKATTDNEGELLLNGAPTGVLFTGNFGALESFTLTNGFLSGANTLEFKVNNSAAGYTGLRVEGLLGGAKRQTVAIQPPRMVSQPQSATVLSGESYTLLALADGAAPLAYQWTKDGTNVIGAAANTLVLNNLTLSHAGSYVLRVSNSAGTTNSAAAVLRVLEPIPGLFNTGVGPDGTVLPDGSIDPHFEIIVNNDTITGINLPDTADANLVAHWTFEEGQGASSPSVAGFWTGNLGGTLDPDTLPTWITTGLPPVNNGSAAALRFAASGANFGVVTTDFPGILGQAPRTVMAWIKWGKTIGDFENARAVIVSWGDPTSGAGGRFSLRLNDSAVNGTVGALRLETSGGFGTARTDLRDGRWHHVAVVHSEAGKGPQHAAFYIDGILETPSSTGGTVTTLNTLANDPVTIGAGGPALQALGNYGFNGWIDDVRIYQAAVIPTPAGSTDKTAYVHDSTVFPIVTGPWILNTTSSKWIGPRTETSAAAGGNYTYRTALTLSGYDPATVVVLGGWAMDNVGLDILVNGVSSGTTGVGFGGYVYFTLFGGFQAGLNTIDFLIHNDDFSGGYTGLRVDGLRAGGIGSNQPRITAITLNTGVIQIQWSGGGTLESAPTVTGPWSGTGDTDGSFTAPAVGNQFYRVAR